MATITQQQIQDYWNANKSDPNAIYKAMMDTGASYNDVANAAGMDTYHLNQYLAGAQIGDTSHPYRLNYQGQPINSLGQVVNDPDWKSKVDMREADPNFGFYEARGGNSNAANVAKGDLFGGVGYTGSTAGLGNYGVLPGSNGSSGGSTNLGMGGGGGGGGSYGGGSSYAATSTSSGGQNPYLTQMGDTVVNQMTDNYNRNQLPAMRSGAVAAGGFGGSRQGVVEANGLNDLNRGIGQNLTNLYGQDWTNAQNRNLQQQSINNSYDLGLKSNDLGYANLDSNNQQFGANYGLNVLNAQNQWAQNGVQATTNMQNTPTNYNTMFNNNQNAIAGQGGTSTSTQNNQGNPWLGALGGAQMANTWLK